MPSPQIFKRCTRIVFGGALLFTPTALLSAPATVRGKAVCASGRRLPPGAYTTLFNARFGRSRQAVIGSDGMFYLYNIPAENYALEAYPNPTAPAKLFQVRVLAPYTDTGQIALPC